MLTVTFAQGLPLPSASETPTAEAVAENNVVNAVTNTATCVDQNPLCQWVVEWTGNPLIGNWVAVVLPMALEVILIILAAWLLTILSRRMIFAGFERALSAKINPFDRKASEDENSPAVIGRRKRATTLGHIFSSIINIMIWSGAIVLVLAVLGFNVAPLLASAGIAGITIGFGAQSLVKDYLTGIFLMIEDQYGVGDWLKLDNAEGEVEAISLRVTQLRDTNGTVWYIPNGQIARVANCTKHWAQALIDLPIAPTVSFEQVADLVSESADAFMADERWRESLITKPEFMGVLRVDRFGPVYRVAIKTQPGQQWKMQRMFLIELKRAFDQAGIELTGTHFPQLPNA